MKMEAQPTQQSNRLRISVALCCYNSAAYLDEQLASILRQSRLPDELVVCDDGSSDGTVARLQEYAQTAPFSVRIFVNERNLGVAKNFEKAITLCAGNVIALCDHDDIWEPSRLRRAEDVFLDRPRVGLVFGNGDIIDDRSRLTGGQLWNMAQFGHLQRFQFKRGSATQALLKYNVVTGATMTFRAEYRELALPVPEGWIHDGWIALVVSFFAEITALDESLIRYRLHASQQVGLAPGLLRRIAQGGKEQRSVLELQITMFKAAYDRLAPHADSDRQKAGIRSIGEKILHFTARSRRPKNRLLRVPMVLQELVTMQYTLYSSGLKSAIWDLLV